VAEHHHVSISGAPFIWVEVKNSLKQTYNSPIIIWGFRVLPNHSDETHRQRLGQSCFNTSEVQPIGTPTRADPEIIRFYRSVSTMSAVCMIHYFSRISTNPSVTAALQSPHILSYPRSPPVPQRAPSVRNARRTAAGRAGRTHRWPVAGVAGVAGVVGVPVAGAAGG
jgi:hypothetical protein